MRLHFTGGAGEVTGSRHLLEVNDRRILLDCGLFQGHRQEANERNRVFPFDPASIDVVVLSHAHIDHSGNLPGLIRQGFTGPVYATSATRDLCAVMLLDSAHIQESDARWYNRKAPRWNVEPIVPLYSPEDALKAMTHFVSLNYDMTLPITDGVQLTFRDAGHVLGSASVTLDCRNGAQGNTRVVFSGDIGRAVTPLLRPPVPPTDADVLLMESTYGNRTHPPYESGMETLADAIRRTIARKGKIIIPTFALERAQEVIYALKQLLETRRIPRIPVYVDSPLTSDITQIFRIHPECFDADIQKLYTKRDSPFYFPGLTYIRRTEDSMRLNDEPGPMLIMSANGMCEAGRILHHLRNTIEDERNTIVFVGYQAEHTLGRRILDRQSEVKIFGRPHTLEADVVDVRSLSAHADREGLIAYARSTRETCRSVILVHGEAEQTEPLAALLRADGFPSVTIARRGQTLEIP